MAAVAASFLLPSSNRKRRLIEKNISAQEREMKRNWIYNVGWRRSRQVTRVTHTFDVYSTPPRPILLLSKKTSPLGKLRLVSHFLFISHFFAMLYIAATIITTLQLNWMPIWRGIVRGNTKYLGCAINKKMLWQIPITRVESFFLQQQTDCKCLQKKIK